jgi:hypothetical protein
LPVLRQSLSQTIDLLQKSEQNKRK